MEIANDLIPSIVKNPSSEIITDPKCFADIIRFYDGLCSWEQGSPTPVLHITWAKHMVATCSKFSASTRTGIKVESGGGDDEEEDDDDDDDGGEDQDDGDSGKFDSGSPIPQSIALDQGRGEANNNYYKTTECDSNKDEPRRATFCDILNSHDEVNGQTQQQQQLALDAEAAADLTKCQNYVLIEKLASSCSHQLLNIDFLLGKANKPFLKTGSKVLALKQTTQCKKSAATKSKLLTGHNSISDRKSAGNRKSEKNLVPVSLHSAKMRGLRTLLCAEKLNTSAITLQLTAQSQTEVASQHRKSFDELNTTSRSKRPRRDT